MKDNRKTIQILLILTIIFTIAGGSLALWNWQSLESQKTTITFTTGKDFSCSADGGGNITPEGVQIVPTTCTDSEYVNANSGATPRVIKRKVTVKPTLNKSDMKLYMNLWLNVNELGTGLSNSVNFRYVLTTSSNSCSKGTIKAKGNFYGLSKGDTVTILNNQVYDSTITEEYWLYIWLDAEETSAATMNQKFNFSLGGECSDQELITPLVGDAYAIYTASDTTLTFTRSETPITKGSTYNGKPVTEVYTGFETSSYTSFDQVPWAEYAHVEGGITKVNFEQIIRPVTTSYWFSFFSCSSVSNLNKLDTSQVTNMSRMFSGWGAKLPPNTTIDLSTFDTSNVIDMSYMFSGVYGLNATGLNNWNVSNVVNMQGMFAKETIDDFSAIANWNTSNVEDMYYMFGDLYYTTTAVDLSNWNVSRVTSYSYFSNTDKITSPNFGTAYAVYTESDTTLTFIRRPQAINAGDTFNGKTVTAVYTGFETSSYTSYNQVPWSNRSNYMSEVVVEDYISPISTAYWFYSFQDAIYEEDAIYATTFTDMDKIDMSRVTSIEKMFAEAMIQSLDLSSWDISNVTNINYVFNYTDVDDDLILSTLDFSNVSTTYNAFEETNIGGDLKMDNIKFNNTKTNMPFTFFGANIEGTLDVSNWNTSHINNMYGVFETFHGDIIGLSSWDVSNVTSMWAMFWGCKTSSLDEIINWNVSKVTDMRGMFESMELATGKTLDLSGWDVSNVTEYDSFAPGLENTVIIMPNFNS